MKTALEMSIAIGQNALLSIDKGKLFAEVKVLDLRQVYGRTEALVQVVQGEGKAWVGFDRLSKITAPVDTVRETGLIKIG
jgi:hypothetical protein